MEAFINNVITNGIISFLETDASKKDGAHIFENKVIELLTRIYSEPDIINPFKLKNEKTFRENLGIYGLTENEIDRFISLMNAYGIWLNSNRTNKNNIFEEICLLLIRMIMLKNRYISISNEELKGYDEFFDLTNNKIRMIAEMSAVSPTKVSMVWHRKRAHIIKNNDAMYLTIIEPKLLSSEVYKKYGVSINEVRQLSNNAIDEINKQILTEENGSTVGGGRTKEKPLQLVLTSGNGFVDMIVLLSIMCTEIMIGIVITVTLMG